ncbi:MAG: carbohydrate kinase family protein [Planctomycetota bacterium]|jgi:sugar/nucleoside kinase (ribokinase family)
MSRPRVIIGIGEAVLAEYPDREEPAGLAALVPIHAVLLGHEGIAISRLGQDRTADVLISALRERGVGVSHLQSDPDLATGRLVIRALGEPTLVDAHAAYDQLQWDFDLADVAQGADAVVFGALIRRSGQSRSAMDRFLDECKAALRVFDLTNRSGPELNRGQTLSGLRYAEAAVVDDCAINSLLPGGVDKAPQDAARELLRLGDLKLVLVAEKGRPQVVCTAESSCTGASPHRRDTHEALIVGFLHGVLGGWDIEASLDLAQRVAGHVQEHPGQPAPAKLLQRP